MTIWNVATVEDQPEIFLVSWQVMETDEGTRHFVGYNLMGEGRVSSAIQTFDRDHMVGQTRSGRVYKLKGPPGHNSDADYVWGRWRDINGINSYKVVTEEVTK